MAVKQSPRHIGRTIRASIRSSATPAQLWEAWADPEKLAQWFPDRAEGRAVEGATQTWYFERFKYALPYEVASAVAGEHLVLTGQPDGRPRFFLEIAITQDAGSTVLTLVNSGFLDKDGWDEEYEGIVSGWQMALAVLKLYAERYYSLPRTQFFAMRFAQFAYQDLVPFYRQPDRLSRWLTAGGAIPEAGQPYELRLQTGDKASGDVLAVTGWEVLLDWREIQGCLALKAFSLGSNGRALCVHASSWELSASEATRLEQSFGAALDRLVVALGTR